MPNKPCPNCGKTGIDKSDWWGGHGPAELGHDRRMFECANSNCHVELFYRENDPDGEAP